MTRQTQITSALRRFFWIFLFVNPCLDILNGFYLNVIAGVGVLDVETATLGVTPTLVIRMCVLLSFGLYLLLMREKTAIAAVLLIGASWTMSVISEFRLQGSISLFTDLQYIARFGYNILLLFIFIHIFTEQWKDDKSALFVKLDRLIAYTLIVSASSILISCLLGVGYNTYADRLGYRGSRGFFYAGNDITAVLVLLMPLDLARLMRGAATSPRDSVPRFIVSLLPTALAVNALLVIGSKTAFLSVGVNLGVMLLIALFLWFQKRSAAPLLGLLSSLAATAVIFLLLNLATGGAFLLSILESFGATGEIAIEEGVEAAVFSGRQFKLREHWAAFRSGGPFVWLFGMGRGSYPIILEMDLLEVLFYYGIFGFATMLWLYAVVGVQFIIRTLRQLDLTSCALILALGICTGYLVMAGHILFSVTSGFYYTFTIIYSRAHTADEPEAMAIRLRPRSGGD